MTSLKKQHSLKHRQLHSRTLACTSCFQIISFIWVFACTILLVKSLCKISPHSFRRLQRVCLLRCGLSFSSDPLKLLSVNRICLLNHWFHWECYTQQQSWVSNKNKKHCHCWQMGTSEEQPAAAAGSFRSNRGWELLTREAAEQRPGTLL